MIFHGEELYVDGEGQLSEAIKRIPRDAQPRIGILCISGKVSVLALYSRRNWFFKSRLVPWVHNLHYTNSIIAHEQIAPKRIEDYYLISYIGFLYIGRFVLSTCVAVLYQARVTLLTLQALYDLGS